MGRLRDLWGGPFWALALKELRQIRRDRRLVLSLVVPPTLQILLFGLVFLACRARGDIRIHSSSRSSVRCLRVSAFSSCCRRFCFCSSHDE